MVLIRFFDIALFLFILNIVFGIVSNTDLFGSYLNIESDTNWTNQVEQFGRDFGNESNLYKTTDVEDQFATLGVIADMIKGLKIFVTSFFYATVYSKAIYLKLGVPNNLSTLLWLATLFMYGIGIYQMISGKNLKAME